MSDKLSVEQIRSAMEGLGLRFSAEELEQLAAKKRVELKANHVAAVAGDGNGIKVMDLGGGCSLYLTCSRPISICYET